VSIGAAKLQAFLVSDDAAFGAAKHSALVGTEWPA
jgi:hypothetical protein